MPIIKNCLTCEKKFKTIPSKIKIGGGKYCSHKCQPVWNKGKKIIKNCLTCGKEFETKPSRIKKGYGKYCSRGCMFPLPTFVIRNCLTCEKEFKTRPSIIKTGRGKYCSNSCKRHSFEAKQRMSEAAKKGSAHHSWKGGRHKDSHGYFLILKPDHPLTNNQNYIFLHRLIIEEQIGRHLTQNEIVHHLGKITNNRPHMLMAFASNSAHTRFHHNPQNVLPEEIIFDGRLLKNQIPSKSRKNETCP